MDIEPVIHDLDDAHDAVRAIHSGDIDGVVVGGTEVVLVAQAQTAYRALVDRMPQGAVTVSAQGEILYANERFVALVGRDRDGLLGESIGRYAGPQAPHLLSLGPTDDPIEVTLLRTDGTAVRVGCKAEGIEGIGARTLLISDLTERDHHREIQERARRNDHFLAVLAHELRNPLGVVGSALEMLDRSTTLSPDDRRYVALIARQAETLARLVDDLLDVHRLHEDKIILRRQQVDMREVMERAVEAARPSVTARAQSMDLRMPTEALPVDADVIRLAQVLSNVLLNASKFTPAGGHIEVVLDRETAPDGSKVACVRVTDDGVGISREHLATIFEPYVQAPNEGNTQQGLGLGLSVARRLIELHGGVIDAHSEGRGKGATLRLHLPLRAEPPA